MDPHEGFKHSLLNLFKRSNTQYFGTQIMEQSIPKHLATGQVELPLITFDQIKRKISTIPSKDRHKIGYIHSRSSLHPHSSQLSERLRHSYYSHPNA